jgi:hypothetical protein
MLHVYTFLNFEEIRKKCTIDLSVTSLETLAEECEKILIHHKDSVIFLGYMEPGWMLDPKHEPRIRKLIRKFDVYMVCFHLESIPFAWKNEIDTVYLENPKNGDSQTINNGSLVHSECKTKHQ